MRMTDDVRINMSRAEALVRDAARQGAQVICLPELYRTQYFPQSEGLDVSLLAEPIPGESALAFSKLARELGVVMVVPVFEMDGGRFYNSACTIDADGALLGTYRKLHLPHDPCFYERAYFEPGDLDYPIFDSRFLRFAVLICYDQWMPEAARIAALKGAEAIFYPTAIGHLPGDPIPEEDWVSAWELVQRSHAVANGIHVAAANRVGTEGQLTFWGSSFVADAFGRILARGARDEETALTAAIDVDLNREIRDGWGFLRNRRPETYAMLCDPAAGRTPQDLGLSMPAEWEPHRSTWLSWPHDRTSFRKLGNVEATYLRIIEALTTGEQVDLIVKDEPMKKRVAKLLAGAGIDRAMITLHVHDYADVWFRDYGPIFVADAAREQAGLVHWRFNAWGNKYPDLVQDGELAGVVRQQSNAPYFEPEIVLEAGSIDGNGFGNFLTTEQCLLDPSRNPGLTREDLEGYLERYLGARQIIWLQGGIAGDDTDGHIDNVARFVDPLTVVCAAPGELGDPNYWVLAENLQRLRAARDPDGRALTVLEMPMPRPVTRRRDGATVTLPGSYLNFYIGNEVVLLPVFGDQQDETAEELLSSFFPDRELVAVDCRDLLDGLGGIHCITQQEPAAGWQEPGASG